MGVEPGAVAASYVEEEEFGGERVGGDVGFAEKMDALFEGGSDIEGLGLWQSHRIRFKKRV